MITANTKVWNISIKKNDLFHDIDELSLEFSKVSGGDDIRRADVVAFESDTANGLRTATRLCDARMGRVRDRLSRFVNSIPAIGDTVVNNLLSSGDYSLQLRVSTECEDNVVQTITGLIHQYIVAGALADWYEQIGMANNRESLNKTASEAMDSVIKLIYYKPFPQ